MTDMDKDIRMAGIVQVPANTLRLAPENPRTDADEEKIGELADSLKVNGQLTPLIVYVEGDLHMITAGGRRYRAMAMLGWTNEMVDVAVYEKDEAIHYGVAEQLAHEKLSRVDEVKLFAKPEYTNAEPKTLAAMIGKSVPYVKQHLKVLCLPDRVLSSFFKGHIHYEHALGLTYFIEHEELMTKMFEKVLAQPHWWSIDRLRNEYVYSFGEWDNHPWARHITKAAYKKAGGTLNEDLFGGSATINNPEIVKELAHGSILKKVKKAAPKGEMIIELTDDDNVWKYRVQPGLNLLTADEDTELCNLLDVDLGAECDGMVPFGGEEVRVDWVKERIAELEEKESSYPPELSKLLATVWQMAEQNGHGFVMRQSCIVDLNRQALIEAGYIEAPAEPKEEAGEEEHEEALSHALAERIKAIALHANRQLLSQEPNHVLTFYSASLEGQRPLMVGFEFRPVDLPAVTLHYDKAFQKLQASQEKGGSTPAAVRDRLTYNLLIRVSSVDGTPDHETIRRYFTPDEDFLKAYKTDQLLDMMKAIDEVKYMEWCKSKKSVVVRKLAELAAENTAWLPLGF